MWKGTQPGLHPKGKPKGTSGNISKKKTTPYHPQGNGVVERGNRTLGDTLWTMLLRRSQKDWGLLLPQIMRAYRATPHSTTGLTANQLLLGREVRLPDQLYHPTPLPPAPSRAAFIRDTSPSARDPSTT